MIDVAEKWRTFREWQERPSLVPKMTDEHHRCFTCGQEFQGNYCPCCGQSARIGRYSFRAALQLFLDVWGVGNRGMFRTLRDLILRPGYMIRDYISGMQMAYFPPFKLLFLLTAFSLVVEAGFNVKGEKDSDTVKTEQTDGKSAYTIAKEKYRSPKNLEEVCVIVCAKIFDLYDEYPNVSKLLMLFGISVFIYFFVRKSPNIPDLRFSELVIAMVYTANMCSIYNIALDILCLNDDVGHATYLLPIIPLKQLTGFKWWRTIFVVVVSYLYVLIVLSITLIAGGLLYYHL